MKAAAAVLAMEKEGFRAYAQGGGCAARDRVTMRRPVSGPMGRVSTAEAGSWTSSVRQPASGSSNVCRAKVMMHPCPLRLAATDSVSPHAQFLVSCRNTKRAGALEEFRGSRCPWHYCRSANASPVRISKNTDQLLGQFAVTADST